MEIDFAIRRLQSSLKIWIDKNRRSYKGRHRLMLMLKKQ